MATPDGALLRTLLAAASAHVFFFFWTLFHWLSFHSAGVRVTTTALAMARRTLADFAETLFISLDTSTSGTCPLSGLPCNVVVSSGVSYNYPTLMQVLRDQRRFSNCGRFVCPVTGYGLENFISPALNRGHGQVPPHPGGF